MTTHAPLSFASRFAVVLAFTLLGYLPLFNRAVAQEATLSSAEKSQLAKDRNAARQAAHTAQAAGQFDAALKQFDKVVDRQRRLGQDAMDEFAITLAEIAKIQQLRADFPAAQAKRREALALVTKLHGADDWRTIDARLALEFVEMLAKLTPPDRAKLAVADEMLLRVRSLAAQQKFQEAIPLAEQLLANRSDVLGQDHILVAEAQHWLGHLLKSTRNDARAQSVIRECLATRQHVLGKHHPDVASSIHNLAAVLDAIDDYAGAKVLYEEALAIRQRTLGEKHPDTALVLENLGQLLYAMGEQGRPKLLYAQALAIRQEVQGKTHPDAIKSLAGLAGLVHAMGDYAGAQPLYEQVLAIRQAALGAKHPDTLASTHSLAVVLQLRGDYAGAKPLYERLLTIRREVLGARHPDTVTSLGNLAALLDTMGDDREAKRMHEEILAIRLEVLGTKHYATAVALNNLGGALRSMGDIAGARRMHEQALSICKELYGDKHRATADALDELALTVAASGDNAGAKLLYEQTLAIRKEVLGENHPLTAQTLGNLGRLHYRMGDYAGAKPLYQQSLLIRQNVLGAKHPLTAGSLGNLGVLMLGLNDTAGAEPLLAQAIEIALASLDQSAAVQSERQQLEMNRSVRHQLDWYLTLADRDDTTSQRAYQFVLAWKGSVFVRQHRLHLAASRPELAESFAEWQGVSNRLATQTIATPAIEQAAQWRSEIAALAARKEQLEADMAGRSAALRQLQTRVTPSLLRKSLPPKTALLDMLAYRHWLQPTKGQVGEGSWEVRLMVFVVRPDREVTMISLGEETSIAESVDAWRRAIEAGASKEVALVGERLRRWVWRPLAAELDGIESVLVSPDGVLAQLPWPALPGAKAGSYLLEEMPVALVPVPQLLPSMSAAAAEDDDGSLLLVGEVDYGGAAGEQLAGSRAALGVERGGRRKEFADISTNTRAEITAIRDSFEQRFPDARVQQLRKLQATEAEFRKAAGMSRWLHLATHGYFAPVNVTKAIDDKTRQGDEQMPGLPTSLHINPGLLSGLALTGANNPAGPGQDDGIMTAVEVTALDLSHVDMAVLSACETGLGKVAGGEGLLGLQRAFQVSGARTTVASLWKVPDLATAQLMKRFYENLWDKKLTRLAALREAQLWMLREGRQWMLREGGGRGLELDVEDNSAPIAPADQRLPPKFWAAFVLSGDWR